MGELEKTLIVITGDHGETVSSYPVGHGLALTREEVFTPFILSNPKLFGASLTSRLTTNHLDIAPTVAHLMGWAAANDWLGRDVLAESIPARAMFVQTKLTQIQGVVDNGILYVNEISRQRGQLFDTSDGSERLIHHDDLLTRYQALNETFQKWAVWHHLARASAQLDASAATQPASADAH
jgi:arylsulfatase A-like enzyme